MIALTVSLLLCIWALTHSPNPYARRRKELKKTLRGNRMVLP